jgi:hypothetical protein
VSRGCDTASLDELWKRSAHRYPVAVVRDGERLARRYLSRPGHEYFQLAAGNRQSVSAWGVLKQTEGMLEWIDLLWDGNDKQALIALDDAADKIAEDNKADRLELWLAHDDKAAEVLESRGWVVGAHAQDLHMTSISFDPEVNEKWLLDHFYFTKGDSDLV